MRIFLILIISLFCIKAKAQPGAFNAQKNNLSINDFYAFNSYETGKEAFVTFIVNYAQTSSSDFANVFFDPNANYEISIDTDGDGIENQTYRFKFQEGLNETLNTIDVVGQSITVPFLSSGNVETSASNSFRSRSYEIELVKGKPSYDFSKDGANRKNPGEKLRISKDFFDESFDEASNFNVFDIPENLIDSSSFTNYDSYANNFIYDLDLGFKKCTETAKVFVGQRKASFAGNISGLYNNLNFDFLGTAPQTSTSADSSVLSIALEIPKACLELPKTNSTIAAWSTIHYPARSITKVNAQYGEASATSPLDYVQIDRVGHPFVNELLVGYNDKIKFSQRPPQSDSKRFLEYFQYPALAELIEAKANHIAPNLFPREDMVNFYLGGIENLNQITENKKAKKQRQFDALRLNTTTTAVAAASQNSLGVLGLDNAGYPNGRRPGDDVVDIFFRTLMGFFIDEANAPSKNIGFSDGVSVNASLFKSSFPYLNSP